MIPIYSTTVLYDTQAQLHMPNTFGVTPLQSSSTRKIDWYSKHWENKLQALSKTVVYNAVHTRNLYHCVCYEPRNGLLGKVFLLIPFFITNKVQSLKKN